MAGVNFKKKRKPQATHPAIAETMAQPAPAQNPFVRGWNFLEGLGQTQQPAAGIEAKSAPPQFVPPNAQPQQESQKALDQRNAGVGTGFVEGSNSPWHTTPAVGGIELKPAGMQGAPLAQPGQGVTDEQAQAAIGGIGDLSVTQGKVTAPQAPTTLDTSAGQYGRSVTPGNPNQGQPMMGVEWSGPQGEASYDASEMGQDLSVNHYAQEILDEQRDRVNSMGLKSERGGNIRIGMRNAADEDMNQIASRGGYTLGGMAQANKNMREGRSGQGSFGISAPGAMDAMAGASGYAGSTPEGQANGGSTGIAGGGGNAPGPVVGGGIDNGGGEGLAAQQARIATMRQWQGIDPSERGKMPQNVRDAFGMGPAPKEKIEAPRRTQEWKRELDMRNAGVGADTAHGKNSPWYNPESQVLAAGRQAAVGSKYAAEDAGIEDFNADKMRVQQREKEMEAGQEMSRVQAEAEKQEGIQNRQTDERIANINKPRERFGAKAIKEYDEGGIPTKERLATYDLSTGLPPSGQAGIEGQRPPETEEAFIANMIEQGVKPSSKEYDEALKNFRTRQGLK